MVYKGRIHPVEYYNVGITVESLNFFYICKCVLLQYHFVAVYIRALFFANLRFLSNFCNSTILWIMKKENPNCTLVVEF